LYCTHSHLSAYPLCWFLTAFRANGNVLGFPTARVTSGAAGLFSGGHVRIRLTNANPLYSLRNRIAARPHLARGRRTQLMRSHLRTSHTAICLHQTLVQKFCDVMLTGRDCLCNHILFYFGVSSYCSTYQVTGATVIKQFGCRRAPRPFGQDHCLNDILDLFSFSIRASLHIYSHSLYILMPCSRYHDYGLRIFTVSAAPAARNGSSFVDPFKGLWEHSASLRHAHAGHLRVQTDYEKGAHWSMLPFLLQGEHGYGLSVRDNEAAGCINTNCILQCSIAMIPHAFSLQFSISS
jgi:hypothetical protein